MTDNKEREQLLKAQKMMQENKRVKYLIYTLIAFMLVFIIYTFSSSYIKINKTYDSQGVNPSAVIDTLETIKNDVSPDVRERYNKNQDLINNLQKNDPLAN